MMAQEVAVNQKLSKNIEFNTSKNKWFRYLFESGNSNKIQNIGSVRK